MEPSQSSQPAQSQETRETQETQDSSADEELPDLPTPPPPPQLPPLPTLTTGRQTPPSTGRQTPPVPRRKRSKEDDSTLMQRILEQTQTTTELQRIMCEAFTQQQGLHADERLQWGNLMGTMCHRMDWDTFTDYRVEAVRLAQEFM